MVPDLSQINGIEDYTKKPDQDRELYYVKTNSGEDKVFLVINKHTIEFRTDEKLANVLKEKYESVMESRYFGRAGLELVPAGQLTDEEIEDLIRLSYRLSKEDK